MTAASTVSRAPRFSLWVHGDEYASACRTALSSVPTGMRRSIRLRTTKRRPHTQTTPGEIIVISATRDLLKDPQHLREVLAALREYPHSTKRRFLLIKGEAPAESIAMLIPMLRVQTADRVHVIRLEDDTPTTLFSRLVYALGSGHREHVILDAWREAEDLIVVSADYRRLRVPIDRLPRAVRDLDSDEFDGFHIDEEGDFIYWPVSDIHMGWEQFEQAADMRAAERAAAARSRFDRRYGGAMRALREASGLTQAGIDGLSARTVQRIEKGITRPTAGTLAKLAQAHGMTLNEYLSAIADHLPDT